MPLFPNLLFFLFLLIGVCNCRTATKNEEGHMQMQTQTLNTNPTLFNPQVPPLRTLSSSKRFEGSSEFVKLKYHMGPVLSSPINIYLIWYGKWPQSQKLLIKDFLLSISASDRRAAPSPSVSDWWQTVSLYTDQTGANISRSVSIAGEYSDLLYSRRLLLEKIVFQHQQQAAPVSGISSIEDEPRRGIDSNNGLSSSDCEESIVSSPVIDHLSQHQPQLQPQLPQSIIELTPDKPLPEKGKLLQAVMKAGPLLQTLLLAGPLPQWRHPPPPLESFEIPPVTIPSPLPQSQPQPQPQLLHHDSFLNTDGSSTTSNCGRVSRKRVFCDGSDSPTETKYQRLVLH